MPRNLDDFELERTPYAPKDDDPEPEPAPREPEEQTVPDDTPEPTRYVIDDDTEIAPTPLVASPSQSRGLPLLLALLAVVSFGPRRRAAGQPRQDRPRSRRRKRASRSPRPALRSQPRTCRPSPRATGSSASVRRRSRRTRSSRAGSPRARSCPRSPPWS
jgi:hypothetical protein